MMLGIRPIIPKFNLPDIPLTVMAVRLLVPHILPRPVLNSRVRRISLEINCLGLNDGTVCILFRNAKIPPLFLFFSSLSFCFYGRSSLASFSSPN